MYTHRVSEYFGDIIEVEHTNSDATEYNATHYGKLPWSSEAPKFASREEKFRVLVENSSAKRKEQRPPFCQHVHYGRLFVIEPFKVVHSAPSVDKPERKKFNAKE
jgi:hypothetical protein